MKISTRMRYGLRFLIRLGIEYGCGPVQLKDVADKECISAKYLEQVAMKLKVAGIIGSARGARGGYFLAKKPAEVTMKDVYEALEGSLVLVDCCKEGTPCTFQERCVSTYLWEELGQYLSAFFASKNLDELVRSFHANENPQQMFYI